jgi:Rv0078B-related antitoxin
VDDAAHRFRLALDMYEVGERMQRQRLRRLHPNESDAELTARISSWRQHRPGALHGDCPGTPSSKSIA